MHTLIKLDGVSFAYDDNIALRKVTFDVAPGESIALMGSNGSGKSTLIKVLNGLIFPQEGEYYFKGARVDEKSMADALFAKTLHAGIGYVFQDSDVQLFCGSVKEEIEFGPLQMGLDPAEISRRCSDVMELLGITDLASRPPYHLSGGEKRKVALASILSMNPEVLILDEPLAGLDEETQELLLSVLKALSQAGKTLIFATHNKSLAGQLATRLIRFDKGRAQEASI